MTATDIKRIAYIRSIPVSRAGPYIPELARTVTGAGREARIFSTDGECGAADFPGGAWEKLPEDATPDQIAVPLVLSLGDSALGDPARGDGAPEDDVSRRHPHTDAAEHR